MSKNHMHHDHDPKDEILKEVGDLSEIEVSGAQVLVATYKRPEKMASGIILPDKTRQEDEYQGKVGLILKRGPLAFKSDTRTDFGGFEGKDGDWAYYRANDGFALSVNGVHCRLLQDTHVRGTVTKPDLLF